LLDQFDEAGELRNRDSFVEKITMLFAAADVSAGDSVQIMTIHKAKGLEFDTVILPGLDRGSRVDDASLLLWMEQQQQDGNQGLLLAPVKEAGKKESVIYDYINHLHKEKQRYEEGRLLYVATTRAKKHLHLFGNVKLKNTTQGQLLISPKSNSLLSRLWSVVEESFQQALGQHGTNGSRHIPAPDLSITHLRRLPCTWKLPNAPEHVAWQSCEEFTQLNETGTKIEFEWAGEAIKHIGTVVHRCIQVIAEEGIDSWTPERINANRSAYQLLLMRLGVLNEEIDWSCHRVEDALIKMITDKRGQWILSNEHQDVHNEYTLTGLYQGKIINVIVDRTFVDENGIRWVVDYKTSRHAGADVDEFLSREQQRYKEQLEKYGTLIQHLHGGPLKLGLYFPLLQGWMAWDL